MLEALQRLAPAVFRHLIAYGELLCDETGDALRQSRRRALGYACGVGAGAMALALACLWVIAANWDGPNRLVVIGALCAGFAVLAVAGSIYARTGLGAGGPAPFERLRAELRADLHELAQLDPSLNLLRSREIAAAATRSVGGK